MSAVDHNTDLNNDGKKSPKSDSGDRPNIDGGEDEIGRRVGKQFMPSSEK